MLFLVNIILYVCMSIYPSEIHQIYLCLYGQWMSFLKFKSLKSKIYNYLIVLVVNQTLIIWWVSKTRGHTHILSYHMQHVIYGPSQSTLLILSFTSHIIFSFNFSSNKFWVKTLSFYLIVSKYIIFHEPTRLARQLVNLVCLAHMPQ